MADTLQHLPQYHLPLGTASMASTTGRRDRLPWPFNPHPHRLRQDAERDLACGLQMIAQPTVTKMLSWGASSMPTTSIRNPGHTGRKLCMVNQ